MSRCPPSSATCSSAPSPTGPTSITGRHWAAYVSITSYVGPVVVSLALVSVARGWRWWHTLVLVSGWLAIGSTQWYHPSYWLLDWPFFGSAHVVTRWRFVAILGLGLAAGSVLARWRASARRAWSALAAGVDRWSSRVDFVVLAHQQLPLAFCVRPEPRWFPGPPVPEIVNVGDGLGYPCVLRGYGVIRGYEPMLSYHRDAPTLRLAARSPAIAARPGRTRARSGRSSGARTAWSSRSGPARRSSSTRIPARGGGSTAAASSRAADVPSRCSRSPRRADATGRLELRIDPPGLRPGIVLAPHRCRPPDSAAWMAHFPRSTIDATEYNP